MSLTCCKLDTLSRLRFTSRDELYPATSWYVSLLLRLLLLCEPVLVRSRPAGAVFRGSAPSFHRWLLHSHLLLTICCTRSCSVRAHIWHSDSQQATLLSISTGPRDAAVAVVSGSRSPKQINNNSTCSLRLYKHCCLNIKQVRS